MSQIEQYRGGSGRTSREISRLADRTNVQVARTAAAAHEESAKLDALGTIAVQAMQGVALVSQLEQSLATAVPLASGRLQAIADMHAFTSADVVARLPRRLS